MILPKRFDILPPDWGMLRRSRCVQIIFLNPVTFGENAPPSGTPPPPDTPTLTFLLIGVCLCSRKMTIQPLARPFHRCVVRSSLTLQSKIKKGGQEVILPPGFGVFPKEEAFSPNITVN